MSVITASSIYKTSNVKELILWETVTCGDTGSVYDVPNWADSLTVQAMGTFQDASSPAVTSTLTIQGSNDGSTWATLHADDGNDITFQAAGMEIIAELPAHIRPSHNLSSGGDVDVYLFARKE
jgi:hypothetical protein